MPLATHPPSPAEDKKFAAEAAKLKAETELLRFRLDRDEAAAQDDIWEESSRTYTFSGPVFGKAVQRCVKKLDSWRRSDPGCDITIRWYSPGGELMAGMYLFDYLCGLRRAGHKVTGEVYGYAASMAGILLQACDVRRIGAESYILIHQISFGAYGSVGVVEDEVAFVNKVSDRVLDIFAARSEAAGKAGTASGALTKRQFKAKWERRDWWLSSVEALDCGVVDEVM